MATSEVAALQKQNLHNMFCFFCRAEATDVANATIDHGDYNASMLVNIYTNLLDLHLAFVQGRSYRCGQNNPRQPAIMMPAFCTKLTDMHLAFLQGGSYRCGQCNNRQW